MDSPRKSEGLKTTVTPSLSKLTVNDKTETAATGGPNDNGSYKRTRTREENGRTAYEIMSNPYVIRFFCVGDESTPQRGERRKNSPGVAGTAKKCNLSQAFGEATQQMQSIDVNDELYSSTEEKGM